jgi:hypothetical protein
MRAWRHAESAPQRIVAATCSFFLRIFGLSCLWHGQSSMMEESQDSTQGPLYDPERMFAAGEIFGMAATKLSHAASHGEPHMATPYIVCHALSLEIFLKCLILLEGRSYKNIHGLKDLFDKLSDDSKANITSMYERHIPKIQQQMLLMHEEFRKLGLASGDPPEATLASVLARSNHAFSGIRYLYEGQIRDDRHWEAAEAWGCVRERILELRPEWSKKKFGYVTTPDGPK